MNRIDSCDAPFEHFFGIDADYRIAVQLFDPPIATIHVYTRVPLGRQIELEDAYLRLLYQRAGAAPWALSIKLHPRDELVGGVTTIGDLLDTSAFNLMHNPRSTEDDRALGALHAAIQ